MPERLLSNRPLRYGQIGGPEVPVVPMELSASFVFNNEGGRLVALDSSEQLVLGGDTTQELIGGVVWGGDYTSSATAGTVVGAPTLLRFYVLHCIFIPIVAAVLMIVHFWRVRKDGGISGPL